MLHDYCVIGAEIIGLATARGLLRLRPDASIIVIDKGRHPRRIKPDIIEASFTAAFIPTPAASKLDCAAEGATAMKRCGAAFRTQFNDAITAGAVA